ncbi:MAG: NAD(P)-dependent oxidoreductase [Clostridia bacterium]|nr:NAD(P)-dependent oxidoreductase [Clostridia bacterium]
MSKVEKKDYLDEAVQPFNLRTAMEEAARCTLCHDAPCSKGCPAGTDPGKFIRSIRFRNFKGAAETIRENNVLGGCCANVCPYDRLCEEACSRTGIDRPIEIGKLQRFAVEQEKLFDMAVLTAPEATKAKVACVGSGPASLSCAAKLAINGYKVTIFEERAKAGGVLTYGIAPSRLPQEVVDFDIQKVKDLGVEFVFNTKIGKDVSVDELKQQEFEAIFLGMGLWQPKMVEVPGMDLQGVTNAVEFLENARNNDGKVDIGDHIIVIGGGDVAMDCAATAKLVGANRVNIVYRRTVEEAPADFKEIQYVQSMGVNLITKFRPKEILGENGKVVGMLAEGTDDYSELKIKADTIVFAIGQSPEDVKAVVNVDVSEKGFVAADENKGITSTEGVFAAGDVVNGGKTVVEAVAQGKDSADSIMDYLSKKEGVK